MKPSARSATLLSQPPHSITDVVMVPVVEHIQGHFAEPMSVESLAQRVDLSREHFVRRFEAAVGEAPAAYIRRQRLDAAAIFLSMFTYSLPEIAEMTGYGSQAALTRAFSRRFGLAPAAFRQRAQIDEAQWFNEHASPRPEMRVVESPKVKIIAMRFIGGYHNVKTYWREFAERIAAAGFDRDRLPVFGICSDDARYTPPEQVRYECAIAAGANVAGRPLPAPFYESELAPHLGVLTLHRGSYEEMQDKLRAVVQWILRSKYLFFPRPAYEFHYSAPWNGEGFDMATHIALEPR